MFDWAPRSWFVGVESAASAFKLTGSPNIEGFSFARSLSFLGALGLSLPSDEMSLSADDDAGDDCAPLSWSVGSESAASAFKLT